MTNEKILECTTQQTPMIKSMDSCMGTQQLIFADTE